LYENHAISKLLDEEKRKNISDIYPSIRRFVEEAPPEALPVSSKPGGAQTQVFVFPTTPEEVKSRRRLTQCDRCMSIGGLIFVFILFVVLITYGVGILLIPLSAFFICLSIKFCRSGPNC